MKVGMMCLWNAANGPSIHAELIGKAWVDLGHELTVFSAIRHPDARPTYQRDEDFVIRHFSVEEVIPYTRAVFFDSSPLLHEEYDVFVAQNLERLPAEKLLELFPKIKQQAVTVQVVHEGKAPEDPLYYQFDWDAIVCFDQRYREYLVKSFPSEKIRMIPYPCHHPKYGDKREARRKLGFPFEDKIIFSFGFRSQDITSVLPALEELTKDYSLRYVIMANPESDVGTLQEASRKFKFVDIQVRALSLEELYTHLHASDVLLIHRESSKKYHAVVSSSVCQVLGSGCPILFHESNYVEHHGDEIVKYRDFEEMNAKLVDLFENKFDLSKVEAYLRLHRAEKIAERYLELFQVLAAQRKRRGK